MIKKSTVVMMALTFFLGMATSSNAAPKPKLDPLAALGKSLYQDKTLSAGNDQSCKSCHHPNAGFADISNLRNPTNNPTSMGSEGVGPGGRNAPTAAYATYSPVFNWDGELFIGGVFWDGRATGRMDWTATGKDPVDAINDPLAQQLNNTLPTGIPLADQAKGPFLNPVEMNLGSINEVVDTALANYPDLFIAARGYETACSDGIDPAGAVLDYADAYNCVAIAIAEFEKSEEFNKFSSLFDEFNKSVRGSEFGYETTSLYYRNNEDACLQYAPDGEQAIFRIHTGPSSSPFVGAAGLAIFNSDSYAQLISNPDVPDLYTDESCETSLQSKIESKNGGQLVNGGLCYACHLTEDDLTANAPVFTDFSYDNLGIPVNPRIALKAGPQPIDYGLGAMVAQLEAAFSDIKIEGIEEYPKYSGASETIPVYVSQIGKFKVSTLRNIENTPPYGHNGFFATLKDIVHFYNARDEDGAFPDLTPEVAENVNVSELGKLGLTDDQENDIVDFLRTLTDE